VNSPAKRHWYQFSLHGLALLVLGLCVGLVVGLAYSPFRKMAPNEAFAYRTPDYVIEPPDVIKVVVRGTQQGGASFDDDCMVGPDGKINVDRIGGVYVTGLTLAEAERELTREAAKIDPKATVEVSVSNYNSKKYYLLTRHNGSDEIMLMPFTGDDHVLDALAGLPAEMNLSESNIWVSRPVLGTKTKQGQILQVDYQAITEQANPLSNYQLLPGDRLFVEAKSLP